MKLTRIDIHGFKSFYRKTVILFDQGITAIVGPNGCGKSNIVDAIKWVMGEQGARNLRGSAMEDVIFAGTKQRGPLGFCEVKLTFEGAENLPPSPRYPQGTSLCVERRMERGKGSDYFINRKRCRLSDVQEVLAGTGVGVGRGGRRAYAIIEQGQIDQVVSAKAEERRFLIEEAAGVTRYRQRRRVAERKLTQTDQNLQRVADIVSEVERQMRALRRQAKKAERYRDYRAEATRIGLKQCAVDMYGLRLQLRSAEVADSETRACVDAQKLALETEIAGRVHLELQRKEAADQVAQATAQLGQFEADAKLTRERLAGFAREQGIVLEQVERARMDVESGESQLEILESERRSVQDSATELEAKLSHHRSLLETNVMAEKAAAQTYLDARSQLESCLRREVEQKHQVTVQEYRLRTATERQQQAFGRLERLSDERDFTPRIQTETENLESLLAHRDAAESKVTELERARACTYAWAQAFGAKIESLTHKNTQVQTELTRAETRCQSLEELQSGAEMWGRGTQQLLGEAGIKGLLIDEFQTEKAFQRAGLSALDRAAEGVIATTIETALKHANQAAMDGLAVQIVIAEIEWSVASEMSSNLEAHCSLDTPELSGRLLSSTALVQNLSEAPQVFQNQPHVSAVVTVNGHSLTRTGVLRTWGTSVADEILERKAEIDALRSSVAVLRKSRMETEFYLRKLTEALAIATEDNQRLGQAYGDARLQWSENKARCRQAEESLDRIRSHADRITRERSELHAVVEGAAVEIESARAELGVASTRLEDYSEEIAKATDARRDAEAAKDRTALTTQSLRAQVVGLEERLTSLKSTLSRLARQEEEVSVRRERFDTMSKNSGTRLSELRTRVAADETNLQSAEASALEWAEHLSGFRNAYAKLEDVFRLSEEKITKVRSRLDSAREESNQAALRVEQVTLRLEALGHRVRDRFNRTLDDLSTDFSSSVVMDDAERMRLGELENLLEKLGEVNLGAIEEFEAISERYEFLIAQRDDLLAAVDDLNAAMHKIDETSKTLFSEAFHRIDELFQDLFPRLFKGGEGRLSLTHPEDLLTTGIEIHCQPPGKRLQSVDLLSGGEKAMCALALVFAVFRFRPSPFCLLDEVDAPLDDINIGRFNEVVRALSTSSQVVLVTHNKRTMEIADALYGVTMEESGISKLVGVQMN